jgi:4-amino-4-deoxychorismate lyase
MWIKCMCRFTEVICIAEGKPKRIEYHNRRCNATRRHFFPGCGEADLREALREAGYTVGGAPPPATLNDAVKKRKCRVEYGEEILGITVAPYTPRVIERLRLVYDDDIDYGYKYADREQLQRLARRCGNADAVIIVKNGRLTDTTFSNIALFNKKT